MTSEERPAPKRQRIAKLMARAGLCSRRDAEAWIVAGRVSVNGETLTSPALDVGDSDAVLVDGTPLPQAERTRLFLFHKPRGLVTSDRDPEGRSTVFDYLAENWPEGPRVVSVGRLDINTEGLLLLTNDGGLARVLELPQTGWARRYRVRAKGTADPAALDALAGGIEIEGIDYAGIEAKLDRVQGANCWLTVGLREGKNREVKRVLEHIGLEVNRLIRISFGPFQLLDLPEGAVEEVRTRVLRDQLGQNLAAQAGVTFEDQESAPHRPTPEAARPGRPPKPGAERNERRDGKSYGRARERTRERDDAPPVRRERPKAGTRKHVSALRTAEHAAAQDGPRRRIERSDTQDRRARTVTVERIVSTRPQEPAATRTGRLPRDESVRDNVSRPGRQTPRQGRPHRDGDGRRDGRPRTERSKTGEAGRRHESPSARGKRERVARSGSETRPERDGARSVKTGRTSAPPSKPGWRDRNGAQRDQRERRPEDKPRGDKRPRDNRSGDQRSGAKRPDGRRRDGERPASRRPEGDRKPKGKPRGPSRPAR